jgi:hypothetical protein
VIKIIPYFVFFVLVSAINGCAQSKPVAGTPSPPLQQIGTDFTFQKFIPGNFIYMNVDVLDNIYLITASNQLKKLSPATDSLAIFNDVKKYGNPSYIDVSNPLKILVYYKNFSTVVVLDRLLVYRNNINLRKHNIFKVQSVATSYDNNIWLFDEQDLKIKKIDDDGKVLQESTDMRLLVDTVPSPSQIIDSEGNVFLYDEQRGFYIFDYYGALKQRLPFLHWNNTAIGRNMIYGFSGNTLYSYELRSLNLRKYELPAFISGYQSIKAMNGKLYLLKPEGIEIYTVK